ncbi:MAG: hypothetical protein AB1765_10795 [Candidatus Hydrogenedentota bacterium]
MPLFDIIRVTTFFRGGKKKDRVIANLGRQDIEGRKKSGRLLKSLRKFTARCIKRNSEIYSLKDYKIGAGGQYQFFSDENFLSSWNLGLTNNAF